MFSSSFSFYFLPCYNFSLFRESGGREWIIPDSDATVTVCVSIWWFKRWSFSCCHKCVNIRLVFALLLSLFRFGDFTFEGYIPILSPKNYFKTNYPFCQLNAIFRVTHYSCFSFFFSLSVPDISSSALYVPFLDSNRFSPQVVRKHILPASFSSENNIFLFPVESGQT